jgi:uncharacterized membrane protein YkoI
MLTERTASYSSRMVAILAGLSIATATVAQPQINSLRFANQPPGLIATQQQTPVSLQQAVAIARDLYPGRIVSATTESRGGRRYYRIRVLSARSRVRTIRIDAETGKTL